MHNVTIPLMASKGDIACDGLCSPISGVNSRNGTRVEIGKPDHHFVDIRPTRCSGREKIVRNVCDYGTIRSLRPLPFCLRKFMHQSFDPKRISCGLQVCSGYLRAVC
jgi:hypothetical protein